MDDGTLSSPADRIVGLLEDGDRSAAATVLDQFTGEGADDRKDAVQSLRPVAKAQAELLASLSEPLAQFLTDDKRAVRLTTAKLLVSIAQSSPESVRAVVPALAARLADEDEFYFVRARSAEALGYVALEYPETVSTPEILADLRIGLSFDEPEVKEKLAKALEYVALGDPTRLRHQLSQLADHLDAENELVRYHLCTAILAVGCEQPAKLAAVRDDLEALLGDENEHVRGRVAEAFGVLERSPTEYGSLPREQLQTATTDDNSFLAERAQFALAVRDGEQPLGTIEAIEATTGDAVEAITTPDGDGDCPHCGCPLPETGPPFCPSCGAPN